MIVIVEQLEVMLLQNHLAHIDSFKLERVLVDASIVADYLYIF